MAKIIVTAALTGSVHVPSMSPYLPITPRQIADEAVRACEAGAAVVHIHVRNAEDGYPVPDPKRYLELFQEVVASVKSRCNVIICLTTGGGGNMTTEQRVSVVSAIKPELASFNAGTLNFSFFPLIESIGDFKYPWEKPFLQSTEEKIFPNTFKTLREFTGAFARNGTKPELEIYDAGMINNVAFMIERKQLQKPLYLQFVLGVLGGIPATPANLLFLYNSARETIGDFVWSVCAAGRTTRRRAAPSPRPPDFSTPCRSVPERTAISRASRPLPLPRPTPRDPCGPGRAGRCRAASSCQRAPSLRRWWARESSSRCSPWQTCGESCRP